MCWGGGGGGGVVCCGVWTESHECLEAVINYEAEEGDCSEALVA